MSYGFGLHSDWRNRKECMDLTRNGVKSTSKTIMCENDTEQCKLTLNMKHKIRHHDNVILCILFSFMQYYIWICISPPHPPFPNPQSATHMHWLFCLSECDTRYIFKKWTKGGTKTKHPKHRTTSLPFIACSYCIKIQKDKPHIFPDERKLSQNSLKYDLRLHMSHWYYKILYYECLFWLIQNGRVFTLLPLQIHQTVWFFCVTGVCLIWS